MLKLHSFLVATYMIAGLALMATTPFVDLRGTLVNGGGATLAVQATGVNETLHGSAEAMALAEEAVKSAKSAMASRQLMLGILLFTLGGFVHAYERVRSERPVHITVKKREPRTLFWIEMNV